MWDKNKIKQSVIECIRKSHYRTFIAVKNKENIDEVIGIVSEILNDIYKDGYSVRGRSSFRSKQFRLSNGSLITVEVPSQSSRGHRFNTLFIDKEITDREIIDSVLRPKLMPYPTGTLKGKGKEIRISR